MIIAEETLTAQAVEGAAIEALAIELAAMWLTDTDVSKRTASAIARIARNLGVEDEAEARARELYDRVRH